MEQADVVVAADPAGVIKSAFVGQPGEARIARMRDRLGKLPLAIDGEDVQRAALVAVARQAVGDVPAARARVPPIDGRHSGRVQARRVQQPAFVPVRSDEERRLVGGSTARRKKNAAATFDRHAEHVRLEQPIEAPQEGGARRPAIESAAGARILFGRPRRRTSIAGLEIGERVVHRLKPDASRNMRDQRS
jgi:hypothetical protein